MRVLRVEDDRKLADMIALGIRADRFALDVARDGQSGWEMAATCNDDLLILDLELPGLSGTELTHRTRLRQQDEKALPLRADAFMEKPLNIPILVGAMKRRTGEEENPHLRQISLAAFVTQSLATSDF